MKKLFCKIGWHNYKLVLSRYSSFNWRDVTYQCQRKHCKKIKNIHIPFDWIYPFKTEFEYNWKEKYNQLVKEMENAKCL